MVKHCIGPGSLVTPHLSPGEGSRLEGPNIICRHLDPDAGNSFIVELGGRCVENHFLANPALPVSTMQQSKGGNHQNTGLNHPVGLTFDSTGNLDVLNGTGRIQEFTPGGVVSFFTDTAMIVSKPAAT